MKLDYIEKPIPATGYDPARMMWEYPPLARSEWYYRFDPDCDVWDICCQPANFDGIVIISLHLPNYLRIVPLLICLALNKFARGGNVNYIP